MPDNWKISIAQFKTFVILAFIGPAIVNIPSMMAGEVKQDGWIAVLLGIVAGLFIIWLYTLLGSLYPNMTLIEVSENILGKWIGKAIGLFFIVFLLLNSAALIYIPGNFIVTQVLPETPYLVVNLLFTITVIIGVRYGLEVTIRAAQILFPWFFWGFLSLIVLASPLIDIKNLQPVFTTGVKPMLKAALYFEGFITLTMVPFLMIFPKYIYDKKEYKNAFLKSSLMAGGVIFIITILDLSVLGSDLTARHMHPSYTVAKKISIGDIIDRIEAVESMVWLIALYYKCYLYFFCTTLGIAQLFKLKDYRPLTLPLGMILVVLSLIIYPNVSYAGEFDTTTWIPYVLTNGLLIPVILLIIGYMRKKL